MSATGNFQSNHASPTPAPVPLLDIARENGPLQTEIEQALVDVARSGRFVLGPACTKFEEEMARLCGAKHAIGCASGSDALLLALMALNVGAGDEVIVPSFTFFATASAPWRLGARPVFVDIDPATFNLLPDAVAAAVTPATKAIIPVHLFGQCAAMDEINAIAAKYNIAVIEDSCQAIGAQHHGRTAGALGDMACFSFYPTKNLGGGGDAGLLTTDRDDFALVLKKLRNHGMEPRYYHDLVGINSRLDALQAAMLSVKLPHLNAWGEKRRANAVRYAELFADRGLQGAIELPHEADGCHHVWNQYTIRVRGGRRDALRQALAAAQVGSEIYYPVPLHQQVCFKQLQSTNPPLPETEKAALEVLSLPIFPELRIDEQTRVVDCIAQFYATSQVRRAA
jgi:dTDP-4-amino-4,6-dideoxygalactose transaminase